MMVILEPALFARTKLVDLLPFLWIGALGRHRVVVSDDRAVEYRAWLSMLDTEIRDDWDNMIGAGFKEDAASPSHYEVLVDIIDESQWQGDTPKLTLQDAIDLLHRPYRILLENGHSDRDFLLSLCDPNQRTFFMNRLAKEWLEFEHCGGIDHLKKRVQEAKKHKRLFMRYSAMFDSDALEPEKHSSKSDKVVAACSTEVHHHRLRKRAIENYLPRVTLNKWCKLKQGPQRRKRQELVDAFFSILTAHQRAHFNMKKGFKGDEKRDDDAGSLFRGIQNELRNKLLTGFDEHIARLYSTEYVQHEHFDDKDGAVIELKSFVKAIIERIR